MPTAFITGITGQDGSYLTELLIEKGYIVHGLVHRPKQLNESNISHLVNDPKIFNRQLFLHNGSLESDEHFLRRVIHKTVPNEVYHLGGQSRVAQSFQLVDTTVMSAGMSTAHLLDIVNSMSQPPKIFLASSCEVFGFSKIEKADERTPLVPTTPYGAAKAFSQNLIDIYRQHYGLHACAGILFNHESPRRSEDFVSMKIARAAAKIKLGMQKELHLGSLTSQRDWGWAPDYIHGMWASLQTQEAQNYVFATGQLHTVQQMAEKAFASLGLKSDDYVRQISTLVRKNEHKPFYGDASKAYKDLNWKHTLSFDQIIEALVKSQYDLLKNN